VTTCTVGGALAFRMIHAGRGTHHRVALGIYHCLELAKLVDHENKRLIRPIAGVSVGRRMEDMSRKMMLMHSCTPAERRQRQFVLTSRSTSRRLFLLSSSFSFLASLARRSRWFDGRDGRRGCPPNEGGIGFSCWQHVVSRSGTIFVPE
jgi:hypothetical protein